jgi:adenosylmethionine-8-amino-7-oxononanoate aminotransferase
VFAKGVTSGYLPLGGVMISDKIAEPFWGGAGGSVFRHGPTYSGHATCCAAGLANIALLERDGLLARGAENEEALLDALAPLATHPAVAEVRGGVGMMAAVELAEDVRAADPGAVARVAAGARKAGVLLRPLGTGVATSPPLTAEPEHFAMIADAVEQGLAELAAGTPAVR